MHSVQAHRALVERLSLEAEAHPLRYRIKLALWALAGFAALIGAIVLSLLMSVGVILALAAAKAWALFKLALIPLALSWTLIKSLWIRFSEPQGHRLAPGEAPRLQALVEDLRRNAGAPRLAGIVITPDLNAAAATCPRLLGLLGNRHFLVLGLPLMERLDPDQFTAVLAHEFGHFSAGHGRFGGWIYRVRASWFRVCEGLMGHAAWMSKPLIRFFQWYAPYFNAYSFVLARSNEYEADAAAARLVGAKAAGQALVSIELADLRLQRDFWPALDRAMLVEPEPPERMFEEMSRVLVEPNAQDEQRLAEVLARPAGLEDSHPVLAQRLKALGQDPGVPPVPEHSAAEVLLGELRGVVIASMSEQWRGFAAEPWHESFARARADRERLQELRAAAAQRELDAEEIGERACLTAELESEGDNLAILLEAAAQAPEHARLQFKIGHELLERGDVSGCEHIERVITLDPEAEEVCLQRLHQWAWQQGGDEAAEPITLRLQDYWRRMALANRERSQLLGNAVFLPADLSSEQLQAVENMALRLGGIAKLWIARKRVQHRTQLPHYVVLVQWRFFTHGSDARLQALANQLPLDGTWLAVTKDGLSGNRKAFMKAAGDPVFVRG